MFKLFGTPKVNIERVKKSEVAPDELEALLAERTYILQDSAGTADHAKLDDLNTRIKALGGK